MPAVKIEILGRAHEIICQAGQEEHLRFLAEKFAKRAEKIALGKSLINHSTVILMAALLAEDEAYEKTVSGDTEKINKMHREMAELMDSIAESIEKVASDL